MLSDRDELVTRLAELRGHITAETAARVRKSGSNLALGLPGAQFESLVAIADDIVSRKSRLLADRYQVLEKLGEGGMGVVYRARDLKLDRIVALKSLGRTEPQDIERFTREARTAASLRHPSIVEVYDIVTDEADSFITMQYVAGRSLAKAARALDRRALAEAVAQAADGLDFAHGKGLVHRDVKPDNILLDAAGHAVLSDFGLARKIEGGTRLTMSGHAVGTPSFMSPEQARADAPAIGPRSDVYGLGATLYDVLSGVPPFIGDNAFEILVAVIDREPPSLPADIPRDLVVITMKAMAKEPRDRYASAADMAADLRRWLRGDAITARPLSSVARLLRWTRRHALRVAAVAAILVAFAGITLGTLLLSRRQDSRADSDLLLQQGVALMNERDLSSLPPDATETRVREALALFAKSTAADPKYALPVVWLGRAHAALQQRDAARQAYDRAIDVDPESSEAHFSRGMLTIDEIEELRRPARLVLTADGIEVVPPQDPPELEARRKSAEADLSAALDLWRAVSDANLPDRDLARYIIESGRGDFAAALAAVDGYLAQRNYSAVAHWRRGQALLHLRRFPDARAAFNEATRLHPNHFRAFSDAVECALWEAYELSDGRKEARAALKLIRTAEDRWPEYWRPCYLEALILQLLATRGSERGEDAVPMLRDALSALLRAASLNRGEPVYLLTAADLYVDLAQALNERGEETGRIIAEGLEAVDGYLSKREDSAGFGKRAAILIEAAEAGRQTAAQRLDHAEKALDSVGRALTLSPDAPDLIAMRGTLRILMAEWSGAPALLDQGLADLSTAIERRPASASLRQKRATALIRLARMKRTRAAYDAAVAEAEAALAMRELADAFVVRGIALLERSAFAAEDPSSALEDAARALRLRPGAPKALALKAGALLKRGERLEQSGRDGRRDLQEAIAAAAEAVIAAGGLVEARLALAMARAEFWRAQARRGEAPRDGWMKATQDYTDLIALAPDHASALIGRGNLFGQIFAAGEKEEYADRARLDFEAARRAAPAKWESSNGLAMLYNAQAQRRPSDALFRKALEEFDRAAELAPANPVIAGNRAGARFTYASFLELTKQDPRPQYDACIKELDTILTRIPGWLRAYTWKAQALLERARWKHAHKIEAMADVDAALASCTKAIEVDATYAEAWKIRGMIHLDLGRTNEARRDIRRAIDLQPSWSKTREPLIPKE